MRATDVNKLQEAQKTGKPILGMAFQTSSAPDLIELLGLAGVEYLFLDKEHQPVGWETLSHMMRACELSGIFPVLRINKQYPGHAWEIRKAYEIGVGMVMVPHINTVEEAIAVVRAAKFSPDVKFGEWPGDQVRGAGSMARGGMYAMAGPPEEWRKLEDEKRMVRIQLEEKRAFDNAEEIFAVEGIDNVVVGPGDLAFSMGIPEARRQRDNFPEYKACFDKFKALQKKHPDKVTETRAIDWKELLTDPKKAKAKIEQGIREGAILFMIGSDQGIVRDVVKLGKAAIDEAYEKLKK